MDLEHLIDSESHLPTQRPHTASKHITKPRQTRQTGSHRSAARKQRLKHLPHAAARANPDRLICRLPIKTFEVGLKIQRPVVGNGGPRRGSAPTETQRPGAGPVLNEGHQLLWSGGEKAGAPRISRLRIEENGTA